MGDQAANGSAASYGFNNNRITNNLIVNCGAKGDDGCVTIYQGANTTGMNYFLNNTLVGAHNVIDFATSRTPYFTIKNNIVYNAGQTRFVAYGFSGKPKEFEMDYNLYYESNQSSYGWQLSGPSRDKADMNAMGMEMQILYLRMKRWVIIN